MSMTQRFQASGLTCGHCAGAVREELLALNRRASLDSLFFFLPSAKTL